jgi:pre-mRNA-splicing factor CWC22
MSISTLIPLTVSRIFVDVFKHDPDYEANEEKYQAVKTEIIGDNSGESDGSGEENDESDGDSASEEEAKGKNSIYFYLGRFNLYVFNFVFLEQGDIVDETETNLIALRRVIYLTIQSSLDHNECAHKMMKMQMKPGQETELCHMILDCCTQQRTYEKFFGLLAQVRFLIK